MPDKGSLLNLLGNLYTYDKEPVHEYCYLANAAKIIILHEIDVAYNKQNAASVHQLTECTHYELYATA